MPDRPANHLADETSPYLRQHAHNPVDWYPWGDAAFARARAEQKPIFLSVGYSTCHWCHVMAHESFENDAVAQQLNRAFVPVKVDREERPDVDRLYMTYVQIATGQGGWPMSVWLTPDLKPFYGGTYFPPEDRWGRPGFGTLLTAVARAWADDRANVLAEAERAAAALREYADRQDLRSQISDRKAAGGAGSTAGERRIPGASPAIVAGGRADALGLALGAACDRCFAQLEASFDPVYGGFGGAPKFPRAAVFNFLFCVAARPGGAVADRAKAVEMAAHTLRQMAEGGLHDHVGGGFHRYSVDGEWFVPHFEKMLYDQAQLAWSYLEARQATGDERHAGVARDIFDYVLRDLASPAGGFYSAEDADSIIPDVGSRKPESGGREGQRAEGAFYLWTKEEIMRVLGADGDPFCVHYGVESAGNVPAERDPHGEFRGKNILRRRRPLAATARQFAREPEIENEVLESCLRRLQAARAQRPRPARDDKIITAWNGLMISALAKGHQVLGDRGYLEQAVRAADFLRRELFEERTGTLNRSYRAGRSGIPGFVEDYAYLIQGLLDLYEAGFDAGWLQWAERLQAKMDELFWDAAAGGYFNSRADDPAIIARLKEDYDGAEPAPVSVATSNLLRLDAMIGDAAEGGGPRPEDRPGCRERAIRCLEATQHQWGHSPQALPQLLCARELAVTPPRTVVLAGDPAADDFAVLAAVLHERLGPRRALLAADGGADQSWLALRRPYLAEMTPLHGRAAAYVCENFTCRTPVTEPAALRRLLME